MTISDHKIKIKSDEALNKTFSEIFIKNHMISINFSDEITVDQKTVFSSKNMNTAEKIIFVLNAVTQIIQLKTANSHST